MLTANRAFALLFTMAACGPVIDIDITSGATGDAGTTTADPATTGLGASESGPMEPGTTFGATSGTGPGESGEDSSSGATGGSSSGGESPPVCTVYTDDLGAWHCECGDIVDDCGCAVNDAGLCECDAGIYPPEVCTPAPACSMADDRCKCDDLPADPWLCGCIMSDDGCGCADGLDYPDYSCGWACWPSGADPCVCGNYPAPAEWCTCVPGLPCWCENLDPPQPCPAG